jgi:hypothetical protein
MTSGPGATPGPDRKEGAMPDDPTPNEPAGDPPADPAPTPAETATGHDASAKPATEPLGDAGKKALADERAARKAAEKLVKDHADQLTAAKAEMEKLRKASMTEQERAAAEAAEAQERAVLEARQQGAAQAMQQAGERLAAAELRAALTGIVPDPGSIVEDLNLARYVQEGGEVDIEAVAKLREKYEALAPARKIPGVPAGPRGEAREPSLDEKYMAALAERKPKDAIALQNQKLRDLAQK